MVLLFIYIYIYIHTHTHTHTLPRNKVISAYLSHLTRIIYVKFEVFYSLSITIYIIILRPDPVQDPGSGF